MSDLPSQYAEEIETFRHISPYLRKTIGYCLEWTDPHRLVSCRSLFSYCGGDHERACFDRVQNPEIL